MYHANKTHRLSKNMSPSTPASTCVCKPATCVCSGGTLHISAPLTFCKYPQRHALKNRACIAALLLDAS